MSLLALPLEAECGWVDCPNREAAWHFGSSRHLSSLLPPYEFYDPIPCAICRDRGVVARWRLAQSMRYRKMFEEMAARVQATGYKLKLQAAVDPVPPAKETPRLFKLVKGRPPGTVIDKLVRFVGTFSISTDRFKKLVETNELRDFTQRESEAGSPSGGCSGGEND